MTKNQFKIFNKIVKREKIQDKIIDKVNTKELHKLPNVDRFIIRQLSSFSSLSLTSTDSSNDFFKEYDNSVNSSSNAIKDLKDYFIAKYHKEHKFLWFSELYSNYRSIFNEFYLWLKYQAIPQLL
jgi:hypothetical protein